MLDWQKRLAHDKADRDALVLCGNTAPNRPDPQGGMIPVEALRFNMATYLGSMKTKGHSQIVYEHCICSK